MNQFGFAIIALFYIRHDTYQCTELSRQYNILEYECQQLIDMAH